MAQPQLGAGARSTVRRTRCRGLPVAFVGMVAPSVRDWAYVPSNACASRRE